LDPERQVHRYLFEHHSERSVWSFWRTAVGTWWPDQFWRELRPAQPSRGKRLVAYWVTTVAFVLAGVGGIFALVMIEAANGAVKNRAAATARLTSGGTFPGQVAMVKAQFGSVQAYINSEYPLPTSLRFYQRHTTQIGQTASHLAPLTVFALGAYIVWPWATIGGLMVFQASMRRARVRPVHVVRCTLYSFDGGVWVGTGIIAVAAGIAWPVVHGTVPGLTVAMDWTGWVPWVVALLLGVSVWRLGTAYRRYLQMEQAGAVVLASQVMVGLAAAAVLFAWHAAVLHLLWIFW
jgi:hypothetical protein